MRCLVYLDESGDPGFATERGSAPVLAVAVVAFDSAEDARGLG